MNELSKWLSANPIAATTYIAASSVIVTYFIAFFQGREISLWPPRIGGKPLSIPQSEKPSMSVMEAIRTRKSIRAYADKPVEEEKLNMILEAGRLAPSASNRQEWRFVIVRGFETRKKLAEAASGQAFVGEAPVVIVACADTDGHVMKCGQLCYPINEAIALDHMTLAALTWAWALAGSGCLRRKE